MIFEMLASFMVGKGNIHGSLKKTDSRSEFLWGEPDTAKIAVWHPGISVLEEDSRRDYCGRRWGILGFVQAIPGLKKILNNRIVHLAFHPIEKAGDL